MPPRRGHNNMHMNRPTCAVGSMCEVEQLGVTLFTGNDVGQNL